MCRTQSDLRVIASLGSLLALLLVGGCQRTDAKAIASWKTAPDGQQKLVAAVKDPKVAPELRSQAGVALVERGEALELDRAISSLVNEERTPLIPLMTAAIAPLLQSSPAHAPEACEALFLLYQQATSSEALKTLEGHVLAALEKGLRTGKQVASRHGNIDMLRTLGAKSVPTLHRVLEDKNAPVKDATEVLKAVGDPVAIGRGSQILLERAQAQPAESMDAPLWSAMATLGGKGAISFLVDKVERGTPAVAEAAAAALIIANEDPLVTSLAIKLVPLGSTPPPVRENLFKVLEADGRDETGILLTGLYGVVRDRDILNRMFLCALRMGARRSTFKAAADGLSVFPAKTPYTPDEFRTHFINPLLQYNDSQQPVVSEATGYRSPIARMVAIWMLEKQGTRGDEGSLVPLVSDTNRIVGFPPEMTVGREAARVSKLLSELPVPKGHEEEDE
jgi:hypothetical protein